jgi:hypothetical protein
MPSRNPYAVLGIPLDASSEAIKAAWRKLARQHHPDVTSGEPDEDVMARRATRRMAEINAAYHELRDPSRRRAHREAAARESRAGRSAGGAAAPGAGAPSAAPGSPPESGHGPAAQPRPERPVTARIDTTSLMRPRNAVLRPLGRSPLPGLPPRPRSAQSAEPPRASTPTGPTHRRPGPNMDNELPTLAKALEMELHFGKFEGLTLGDVVDLEPTYVDWIVRTIDRDPSLILAARVVQRHLDRIVPARKRRLDTSFLRG